MAEKRRIEYFLLRYVPDAVKGEFVNFGVVAFKEEELIDVRITKDWGRVECLDPQVDVDYLIALGNELKKDIGSAVGPASLLAKMQESFSGVVQLSVLMPALTEQLAEMETDTVVRIFLETVKVRRTREPAGRQKILQTMRDEFERANVLGLLNAVPAAPYTKPGDPFEFDFGYRFGGEIKLFHAVSMRASVDAAVTLAARYPKIVPAMARLTETSPVLTAVVEAELDRTRSEVGFALEMMGESGIRVAAATEMRGIAEVARGELKA